MSKSDMRIEWERQLAGWPEEARKYFDEALAIRHQKFPTENREWSWSVTFRECRSLLLRYGNIRLEDIPSWGLTGEGKSEAEMAAIPSDDSYERTLRAAARAEEERRRRHAENEEELDEPRRQKAWDRRSA